METKALVQWIFLGRDCWREIFSNVSFRERNRLRIVCKNFNQWIIEQKDFWPLGKSKETDKLSFFSEYEQYFSIVKNVWNQTYKQYKAQIENEFKDIFARFNFGIVLVWYKKSSKKGFSIYSKDLKHLFSFDKQVDRIQASKDYIVYRENKEETFLLKFKYSSKDSLEIESKTLIDIGTNDYYYSLFEYPYFSIRQDGKYKPILINLLNRKNLLNKAVIPEGFSSDILYNEYFSITNHTIRETWIYEINQIDKPPYKIKTMKAEDLFIDEKMFFLAYSIGDYNESMIDAYNLKTKKYTKTEFQTIWPMFINKDFVITEIDNGVYHILRWNQDFTQLTLWKELNSNCIQIDCFHPSLPFFAIKIDAGEFVYSKKGKELIHSHVLDKEHYLMLAGDQYSRLYFLTKENGNYFINGIDFK